MAGEAVNIELRRMYVYPVKSCGGVSLREAALDDRGLRHDRRWMLVDGGGRFVSQRRLPRMALISTSFGDDALLLDAPGMPTLSLVLDPTPDELGPRVPVRVHDDETLGATVGQKADRWLGQFLGPGYSLVYMPDDVIRPVDGRYASGDDRVGFADGFPFLLLSEASLADLNSRLDEPIPENRFRPNFVVSGEGALEAYVEDDWQRLRIGEVDMRVAKPCSRCKITTVDQKTAQTGREPLRTLARYRHVGKNVMFGQNLVHDSRGRLNTGDPVEVLERLDIASGTATKA